MNQLLNTEENIIAATTCPHVEDLFSISGNLVSMSPAFSSPSP